jgi:hypothetical protein
LVGMLKSPRDPNSVKYDVSDQGRGVKGQGQIFKNNYFQF